MNQFYIFFIYNFAMSVEWDNSTRYHYMFRVGRCFVLKFFNIFKFKHIFIKVALKKNTEFENEILTIYTYLFSLT